MADDSLFDEIQDNTEEAGQRLRASLNLLRSQVMLDDTDYRELVTRLSAALAMHEVAYFEARRRKDCRVQYRDNVAPSSTKLANMAEFGRYAGNS